MIFKKHRSHQAVWKLIQDMYCEGERRKNMKELKLVRRLRHADTGYYCYFRKEKEFLFEHKGVDPKEILMAFVLLKDGVYQRIASFL